MSRVIQLQSFEWERFEILSGAFRHKDYIAAGKLLARPPLWVSDHAQKELELLQQKGAAMSLIMSVGLAAAPKKYSARAISWLAGMDVANRNIELAVISAAQEPLILPLELHMLLGSFSAEWRSGNWNPESLGESAPENLIEALGGLTPGTWIISQQQVSQLAEQLKQLEPQPNPGGTMIPWQEIFDPEGDLDNLCRDCIADICRYYQLAAASHCGMLVTS